MKKLLLTEFCAILKTEFFLSISPFSSHSYIHNWPFQHFSEDYGLASHNTHVVCVNFIREWWDLQFNAYYIYLLSEFLTSAERKYPMKYFCIFRFDG